MRTLLKSIYQTSTGMKSIRKKFKVIIYIFLFELIRARSICATSSSRNLVITHLNNFHKNLSDVSLRIIKI